MKHTTRRFFIPRFVLVLGPRPQRRPCSRARSSALARASLALAAFVSLGILKASDTPEGVAARNVQTVSFFSQALNQQRAFNVILPADYDNSPSRYPVLYLLHGYTGNNTNWALKTNLSEYAARYRLIIVMPDGSNGWYVNSATDPKAKFEDYIIQDLIPYVEAHYRTIELRRARAIAGLSMGGYGASFLGLKHYDLFCAVGSFSGAVGIAHEPPPEPDPKLSENERRNEVEVQTHFGPAGSPARKERDPIALLAKVPPGEMPMLYIAEGGQDFLLKGNREFVDALAAAKIPYEYREISPREHTWPFWDEQIQIFLEKLARVRGFESRWKTGDERW